MFSVTLNITLFQEQDPSVGWESPFLLTDTGPRDPFLLPPAPISGLLTLQPDLGTAGVRPALRCLQLPLLPFPSVSQTPAVGARAKPATVQPKAAEAKREPWIRSI